MKEKLDELEKKINICNDKLASSFNASKTAEIKLNFYCNYVKSLYLALGEKYEEIGGDNLIKNLK